MPFLCFAINFPEWHKFSDFVCNFKNHSYICSPFQKGQISLRYGVMVALQILALSVRVRVLLSQLSRQHRPMTVKSTDKSHGGLAQLVRAHDS